MHYMLLYVIKNNSAKLELRGNKSVVKMEENPWVQPIAEQYLLGISHVLDYIDTEAYRMWVLSLIFHVFGFIIIKNIPST